MKHISFTILVLLIFTAVHAQVTRDTAVVELDQVVISADYLAEKITPITHQNLDEAYFEFKSIGQEPSFILSETPSMTVYSDAGSYQGYSYFRLRGIDQTRLNITLDGVPLNEPEDQGVYFSNYPDILTSVSNIQIQRGVGTSKNGAVSYGGSIQLSSPNLFKPKETTFSIGYGSYNSYRVFGEYNSGVNDGKGLYVRASHIHSDGYKERSANTSGSVFYTAGLFSEKHNLKLVGFAGNQKNEMAWLGVSQEEIDQNPRANANTNEDDNFTQSLTQLQHKLYISDRSTLSSSLFYNYLEGDYDFDLNNFLGLPSTDEMLNYAFKSNFLGAFSNYSYEKNNLKWITGFHLNAYSRDHIGSERSAGRLYENTGFKKELSVFTKILWQFNRLSLFGDLQYRTTGFDYDGSVSFTHEKWNFLNPKVGVTYNANEKTNLYYSFGYVGREPTRNDMFGGWDDLQADSLGNPILSITKAEYVSDHEVGVRYSSAKFKGSLNLFYMSFENEILLKGQFGPNGLALNDNVDESVRSGIELSLEVAPTNWLKLINNSSYIHSNIEEQNENFKPILTPHLIINQDVVFTKDRLETGLSIRYQSISHIDFANENTIDDYFLVNWRGSYTISQWRVSLFINNLTNADYYNNGYVDFDGTNRYFVQAPTNVYGQVSLTF